VVDDSEKTGVDRWYSHLLLRTLTLLAFEYAHPLFDWRPDHSPPETWLFSCARLARSCRGDLRLPSPSLATSTIVLLGLGAGCLWHGGKQS